MSDFPEKMRSGPPRYTSKSIFEKVPVPRELLLGLLYKKDSDASSGRLTRVLNLLLNLVHGGGTLRALTVYQVLIVYNLHDVTCTYTSYRECFRVFAIEIR